MDLRPYEPTDLDAVIEIFRSNIPKYFGPSEEPGLRSFLSDPRRKDYFACDLDGDVIGAGGIALNSDDTVSLCWGMIRSDLLGRGFGKQLTEFRINAARDMYPTLPLVINTSQHTRGFYERFGFRLTYHEADGFGPGIDICKMRLDTRS